MKIASASVLSTAPASAFFRRWADMSTWPEWNSDLDWVRLDGPFTQGATGVLKPTGGPKVRFTVETLVPGRAFVDVSHLLGARLTFDHQVSETDAGTRVDVDITITGPLTRVWKLILGKDIAASVKPDLEALVAVAETDATPAAR